MLLLAQATGKLCRCHSAGVVTPVIVRAAPCAQPCVAAFIRAFAVQFCIPAAQMALAHVDLEISQSAMGEQRVSQKVNGQQRHVHCA